MSRIYYCNKCKNTVEFQKGENEICKCGCIFGGKINDTRKDHTINMRNTWSGQTQIEFNQTTLDQSVKDMRGK
jgi:hypothetical protein